MAVYTLLRTTVLNTSPEKAWDFFSNPGNLSRITPPAVRMQVVGEMPDRIYAGLMIQYRMRPLFGIPVNWLTEITQVNAGRYFVDEQREGPYRLWHHEHFFDPSEDGRVKMTDRVSYILPFGWPGRLVHPFLVAPQLDRIFNHRQKVTDEIFPPASS